LLAVGAIDYDAAPAAGAAPQPPRRAPDPLPLWHALAAGGGGYPNLPGTGNEVRTVVDLYRRHHPEGAAGSVTELRGADASEERLKANLGGGGGWGCIHFAGHGFFVPQERVQTVLAMSAAGSPRPPVRAVVAERRKADLFSPFFSGLVLAGANRARDEAGGGLAGPEEDCVLTAEEIRGLDLRGTDLVVLSACNSGRGAARGGEGVVGLPRAFHAAGARSVVVSLWQADDDVTNQLMTLFYENLWKNGMGKLQALRHAQLTLLRHGKGTSYLPYYWSGLALTGDPGDMEAGLPPDGAGSAPGPKPPAAGPGKDPGRDAGTDPVKTAGQGGDEVPRQVGRTPFSSVVLVGVAVPAAALLLLAAVSAWVVWRRTRSRPAGGD
jgi:hypothetical protein